MKNRRELLRAIPFLAAIPFVRIPNSVSDLFKNWKSYPNHVTANLPPKSIDIHPYDMVTLLNGAPKGAEMFASSKGIEINGLLYKITPDAKVVTEDGKKLKKSLDTFKAFIYETKNNNVLVGGWVSGPEKHATFLY